MDHAFQVPGTEQTQSKTVSEANPVFSFACTPCSNTDSHFCGAPVKCASEADTIFAISCCSCVDTANSLAAGVSLL